jgi:hypothetical protein
MRTIEKWKSVLGHGSRSEINIFEAMQEIAEVFGRSAIAKIAEI